MKDFTRIALIRDPSWWQSHPSEKHPYTVVDVESYWAGVKALKGKDELLHRMHDPHFWEIVLRHMGIPKEGVLRFHRSFSTSEAKEQRLQAILGLKRAKRSEDLEMIKACKKAIVNDQVKQDNFFFDEENVVPSLHTDVDGKDITLEDIGRWFANMVSNHEIDDRKYDSMPPEEKNKYALDFAKGIKNSSSRLKYIAEFVAIQRTSSEISKDGKSNAWRVFCEFVCANERLPTIAEFQTITEIGQSEGARSTGHKIRKKLGIGALPESY